MNRKVSLIAVACLIGLITASIYANRLQLLRSEIALHSKSVPVLTLTRNISIGETLAPEDIEDTAFPMNLVSERAISPENIKLIIGRQVLHPISKNEPVLWTDFPEGPRLRLASERIPPGYRVIALPADEIHTLTHLIRPGDKVDIVSSTIDNSQARLDCRMVAENISVYGVGHAMSKMVDPASTESHPASVSILVRPDDAVQILHASQIGEIHFMARRSTPFAQALDRINPDTASKKMTGKTR